MWILKDDLIKDGLENYINEYELSLLPGAYINMKIRKKFNNGILYDGIVENYDKKNKWFKIKYTDGDEEELNLNELKKVLMVKPKRKPITEIRKN